VNQQKNNESENRFGSYMAKAMGFLPSLKARTSPRITVTQTLIFVVSILPNLLLATQGGILLEFTHF